MCSFMGANHDERVQKPRTTGRDGRSRRKKETMSAPPGPDPWGKDPAVAAATLQVLRDLIPNIDGDVPDDEVTAWADRTARRRSLFRSPGGSTVGFEVSSDEEKEGARILNALADSWTQKPIELGRSERWRALKLFYLARHELLQKLPKDERTNYFRESSPNVEAEAVPDISPVTSTEWTLLSRDQQDVVNTPRLQTVFEKLGIAAAAENPIHLNEDWFGEIYHWWPATLETTGFRLEIVVIEGFIRMLQVSLAWDEQRRPLRAVRKLPGEDQDDLRWLSTFSRPWNGDLGSELKHDKLRMFWLASKELREEEDHLVLSGEAWKIEKLRLVFPKNGNPLTLSITTPMPLHPDRFSSPPDLP